MEKTSLMSGTRRRFAQEFKDELCQEVLRTSRPIKAVAEEYGVGAETLRTWLRRYKQAHGTPQSQSGEDGQLNTSERARLKELERENAELRAERAFLKKAAAYFARDSSGEV